MRTAPIEKGTDRERRQQRKVSIKKGGNRKEKQTPIEKGTDREGYQSKGASIEKVTDRDETIQIMKPLK